MLKTESKKRRTRREIEEAKQSELEKDNEYRSKMARLDMIELQLAAAEEHAEMRRQQLASAEEQAQTNRQAANLVSDMINAGVIQQEDENSFVVAHGGSKTKFEVESQPNQD